jgi:hypothetical protein
MEKQFSTKVEFDHSEYIFSHGKQASGRGSWAFKVLAWNKDEIIWFNGTLTECKAQIAERVRAPKGFTVLARVLP